MRTILLICFLFIGLVSSQAFGQKASIRETVHLMDTYAFSDPDPVPRMGYIYPYFRFDGYSSRSIKKEWRMVELENEHIKVFITPEIGGKIWGALEKSTGKEFVYFNKTVKFRDIAMRGPWTSGGIETNFGVIGHAPTCSTPVDYITRENGDGSVSCIIGATDWPSRTYWRMEIRLPAKKAWFSTNALWVNPSLMEQSYYHWMNGAVKADGNLEFAYPGDHYIGHNGKPSPWPRTTDGQEISWYEKNNFGSYKSYHVLGHYTDFYGGYWHDDAFGFGHYSPYDEKPGKKLWIWGLSRQGMIWEELLTDQDGQYVEIQSGRLFNQEAEASIHTPFKHRGFAPLSADRWTEYWFPIKGTKGVLQGAPEGSVNLKKIKNTLHLWFCANEPVNAELVLEAEEKVISQSPLICETMETVLITAPCSKDVDRVSVRLGDRYLIPKGGLAGQKLKRPLNKPAFDWSSFYGLCTKAQQKEKERDYNKALELYGECLEKAPHYIPALTGRANLLYRRGDLVQGLEWVKKA